MSRKKNIFKNLNLKAVRQELYRNVEYIDSVNLELLNDEIEFSLTATGGLVPKVTTTIEQRINSMIVLIQDSIQQMKHIVESEGMDDFIQDLLDSLKDKIKEFQIYYASRPPTTLKNREHVIKRKTKAGKEYDVKILAANVPSQVTYRSKTLKIITELAPIIATLDEVESEEFQRKGTIKELPTRLIGILK